MLHPWGSETPPDIPGFVRCGSQPAGYPRVLVRAACERAGYPRVRSKLLPISSVIPARGFVPPLGVCGNPLISYLVPAAGINLGPIKFPPARSTAVPLEINPSPLPAPASRAYRLQSAILTKTWGAFGHRSSAHRPLSFPLSFAPSPMHHSVHWMSPAWHRATFSPTSCSLQPILGCRRCPCAVLALSLRLVLGWPCCAGIANGTCSFTASSSSTSQRSAELGTLKKDNRWYCRFQCSVVSSSFNNFSGAMPAFSAANKRHPHLELLGESGDVGCARMRDGENRPR